MKALVKRAANALGYQIGPADRWSSTVEDYYPVHPKARWGHGNPSNPHIRKAMEKHCDEYRKTLQSLAAHRSILLTIKDAHDPAQPLAPYWDNVWFQTFDAASLMCFLIERNPKRYIEIGSGHSTTFAHHAIQQAGLRTKITSIDPQPRAEINSLCDSLSRCRLEDSDLLAFDELEQGDLLFFDGSHRVFQNSDVTVFFLEVLPRLKPGVLVHIHDIFLPDDYPTSWTNRLFSEQYMLGVMVLCEKFKIILPNYFVSGHDDLGKDVRELFKARGGEIMPAAYFRGAKTVVGSSFWFETT